MSIQVVIYSEYPVTGSDLQILNDEARESVQPDRIRSVQEFLGMWYGAALADEFEYIISSHGSVVDAGVIEGLLASAEERDDGPTIDSELLGEFARDLREIVAEPGHKKRSYNLQVWD